MRNLLFILLLPILLSACQTYPWLAQQQTMNTSVVQEVNVVATIADTNQVIFSGMVKEVETGDAVLFGSVAIYQNNRLVAGTETDFDGGFYYQLNQALDTLTYALEVSYLGMNSLRIDNLKLVQRDSTYLSVKLGKNEDFGKKLNVTHCFLQVPLIEQDNTTSGQIFTSDQIRRSATRGN